MASGEGCAVHRLGETDIVCIACIIIKIYRLSDTQIIRGAVFLCTLGAAAVQLGIIIMTFSATDDFHDLNLQK
jgi:2C-methyl-D-erythritol 2,4-cyclodiphosphate synthase